MRAVKFHRGMAPYEAGDIAGFPHEKAEDLVRRGIADFHPPVPAVAVATISPEPVVDFLTDMDRAALVTFGKENLGMADEPPAEVDDEAIRDAIRASADPAILQPAPASKVGKPKR